MRLGGENKGWKAMFRFKYPVQVSEEEYIEAKKTILELSEILDFKKTEEEKQKLNMAWEKKRLYNALCNPYNNIKNERKNN